MYKRQYETEIETAGRLTRRFFEAHPLEKLATIPLAGEPAREIYEVKVQVSEVAGGDPVHAKMQTGRVQPGMMDELIRIAQDFAVPLLKQQDGFKSYFVLTQGSTCKELAITLWEKESDERNWEMGSRYRELTGMMTPLLSAPPAVERYEVSLQM